MKKSAIAILLLSTLAVSVYLTVHVSREDIHAYVPWALLRYVYSDRDRFLEYPIPQIRTPWLYDCGVVDANGDGFLDIYTSNHNWRQSLLLSDGAGHYIDVLTSWGLDQSREFPDLELSLTPPLVDEEGLYVYWHDEDLILHAHNAGGAGPIRGVLRGFLEGGIRENRGFDIDGTASRVFPEGQIEDTTLSFSAQANALLRLSQSPEYPVSLALDEATSPSRVYIGNKKVPASGRAFVLALRDRHAMAWADVNDDGRLDLFVTRGGMGGWLRKLPEDIAREVRDELFVSDGADRFSDCASEMGISKRACSGRQASWVDFNGDGLLDLFVNCQDRGRVPGDYPKQLYRQTEAGRFVDVAEEAGLASGEHFLRAIRWLDVDNDGDPDLLVHQENGFFLYRNHAGRFTPELVHRGQFEMEDVPGLKYGVTLYWRYDGGMSVTDFDGDGDMDVFASSKKGSALLVNENGRLAYRAPASLGLPGETVAASWTDYDNDGRPDLHAVPQGLFAQAQHHRFQETGLLMLPLRRYMAAIVNWFDLDNDGARDVSMAVIEDPTRTRWWEFRRREPERWTVMTYRNVGATNHWLQVELVGGRGNREAIGSRVTITTPDGEQTQEVGGNDGAFFSQGHYRLYFGLGPFPRADGVKVRWADGHLQELRGVEGDRLLVIDRSASP